ncbi:MAG: hydroxymethylbilane synthase [Ignavibacteria bacterium]|nr:hydroxymethylbilane synthase [Ignavibacteria bacterium]
MKVSRTFILGTRGSELALWQAEYIKSLLEKRVKNISIELKIIKTKGDKILDVALSKIGDKGLFTKELENKLLNGEIDFAVHSLKDMETKLDKNLILAAITKRHKVNDVIISKRKNLTINKIPLRGKVATGSLRRTAQLLHLRPDIQIFDLRGNVPTRIQKYLSSNWDAIILASAGVERLNFEENISSTIPKNQMLPAVGQGAIAVECRKADLELIDCLKRINHVKTEVAIRAERAFLKKLEGGCQVPIAAYGYVESNKLTLIGRILSLDGSISFEQSVDGSVEIPEVLGEKLARNLLAAGAGKVLAEIKKQSKK